MPLVFFFYNAARVLTFIIRYPAGFHTQCIILFFWKSVWEFNCARTIITIKIALKPVRFMVRFLGEPPGTYICIYKHITV